MPSAIKETEKAPPGWEDTVKRMKVHPEINNPFALAWWMSGQGDKPGGSKEIQAGVEAFRKTHPDGGGVVGPVNTEANSGSSMGQLYRPSGKKVESKWRMRGSLREANVDEEKRTVEVVLIEEGLGNFGDMHYYTPEALKSMPTLFDGLKIYADHPSRSDETDRPERSTRDIIGFHSEVRYAEDSGRGKVLSVVKITPGAAFDWAWQQIKEAVVYAKRYADKDFVGVSINANGETISVPISDFLADYPFPDDPSVRAKVEEAAAMGKEEVFIVQTITDAVSGDMVTEAGAGGKFVRLKESNKGRSSMKIKAFLKALLERAKGEEIKLTPAEIKAGQLALKEDGGAAGGDGHAEPDGDEPDGATTVHVHANEDEAMVSAYGRHMMNGGKMKPKEFEAVYKSMMPKQSESETDETDEDETDESEDEKGVKASESKRFVRLEAENVVLKERLRKVEMKSVIDDKLLEAGFTEAIEKRLRPMLEKSKTVEQIDSIINQWSETVKEIRESDGILEGSPAKGASSMKESNFNHLFSGCSKKD